MDQNLSEQKCKPCEGGMSALAAAERNEYLSRVLDWELVDNKKIKKEYKFPGFKQALDFVNKVGMVAEAEGHHPSVTIIYNKVYITCWTHALGGLSENDFILAAKLDKIIDK